MQVAQAVHRYGRRLEVRVLAIYGGAAIEPQLRALRRGVDVVVATPGRALDHIRRGSLSLESVRVVVLDEADEMLDMGFIEDLEAILSETPPERQTVLFSATMPPRIESIARNHARDPARITIAREPVVAGEAPKVRQTAYVVARPYKPAALARVLDIEAPGAAIVFCRTRTEVDELSEALNARGYRAEALHGGLSQEQRDRVMKKLRGGTAELLVATDVAARGLDIELLTHVVNYDVPLTPEDYVHRIGRVGRAGREGVAITLAEPREHRLLRNIEHLTRQRIQVAAVPTVADLRNRQLELTRASVRETLLAGGLDRFRSIVEALSEEFDVMDVALAAVKLAHRAEVGPEDEEEIPAPRLDRERPAGPPRGHGGPPGRSARLYVGLGRSAGVRPQDLVGAIAGEAGLPGRAIGAIEIAERFSIVEVPEEAAARVIEALRNTRIKGKRVPVRRDTRGGPPPRRR
jgi:ATP-dependent RNA helicase DeaD